MEKRALINDIVPWEQHWGGQSSSSEWHRIDREKRKTGNGLKSVVAKKTEILEGATIKEYEGEANNRNGVPWTGALTNNIIPWE